MVYIDRPRSKFGDGAIAALDLHGDATRQIDRCSRRESRLPPDRLDDRRPPTTSTTASVRALDESAGRLVVVGDHRLRRLRPLDVPLV